MAVTVPDCMMALCDVLGAMVTTATAGRTGEEGAATVAEMAATASTTGVPAPEGKTTSGSCVCPRGRTTLR